MSIISFYFVSDNQYIQQAKPRTFKMVTTANLATITTAGYLSNGTGSPFSIEPTDVLEVTYSYSEATKVGTYGKFIPTISNGIITLSLWANPGNVDLPVTSGHFAFFNGTTGKISDQNKVPSDATQLNVVMQKNPSVINGIPGYTDLGGTIQNKYAASDTAKVTLSSVDGPTGVGAIATFSDIFGTVKYGPGNVRAQQSNTYGGGGTSFIITDANITTAHNLQATLKAATTPVGFTAAPGSGNITITFAADPGPGTIINYYASLNQ